MQFKNEFDVDAPIDEVWEALLDVQRVAPCVPGAEVSEHVSEKAYKVGIKVKVGPISMQYRGEVEIVDADREKWHAVLNARARETRGQGRADANVSMDLAERDGRTHGTITADVSLSGRAAAMGRGVIQDVSGRIVDSFAANLARMLSGPPAEEPAAAAEPAPAAAPAGGDGASAGQAAAAEPPPAAAPPPPPSEEEALPMGSIVGRVLAERLRDPRSLAAIAGVLLFVWLLRRTRR
jgi:uncharacterized protein